jgi:hypothetical protein
MSVALVIDNESPAIKFLIEDLAKSGLTPEDFDLAGAEIPGIIPIDKRPDNKHYGYAIQFPTEGHAGFIPDYSVKRWANNPKNKYDSTPDRTFPYWVTPNSDWVDARVKYVVEGEKKSVAFQKYLQLPTVGIRGCWGFQRGATGSDETGTPMDEIVEGIYEGDTVIVLMDGDMMTHRDIRRAAGTLARVIVKAKATPVFKILPYTDNSRMGADDWIMSFPPEQRTVELLRAALDARPVEDWMSMPESAKAMVKRLDLMVDKNGNAVRNDENTRTILNDLFGDKALFYDQYRGPMYMPRGKAPITYTDDTLDSELYRFIERTFSMWSKESFRSVRRAMVAQTKRNLLGEHIASVQWDGVPRIEMMLIKYFGAEDTPYNRKVSKGTCLGAISRCMDPGSKWDHVLILEGKQRTGKSYGLELLFYEHYVSVKMGLDSASLARQACSAWCVNCDELDHMNKAGREAFKAWVTERIENWVPKYVEYAKTTPRPFIITGTTNDHAYLDDPTGAQRFWPVKVAQSREKVDHEGIKRDRDQIWAEAYYIYANAHDTWWFEFENDQTGALVEQEMRSMEDPLSDIIFAAMSVSTLPKDKHGKTFATFHWLLQIAQNANLPASKKTLAAVSDAVVRLGMHKRQVYRTAVDPESLAVPCRSGSQLKVINDQYPEGFVPERFRVYYVDEPIK